MVFPIETPKDSWPIVLRLVGMLFELSMATEMKVSRWLTKKKLVFFIGVNPWIDTQNKRSN